MGREKILLAIDQQSGPSGRLDTLKKLLKRFVVQKQQLFPANEVCDQYR